jgi:hypothetical protein
MTNAGKYPDPHPYAPRFEYAMTVRIKLAKAYFLKPTTMGGERAAVFIESGEFEGPNNLKGQVLPGSGGDYPLVRPNGIIDFDARYLLLHDDGTPIYLQSRGYRWGTPEAMVKMSTNQPVTDDEYYMRVSPKFDVPEGPHDWMSKYIFVGVAEKVPFGNAIHYFKVL